MESWDTSPHLGVTELWQSVILELSLHAPRSREVVLLSVYSRIFLTICCGQKASVGRVQGH